MSYDSLILLLEDPGRLDPIVAISALHLADTHGNLSLQIKRYSKVLFRNFVQIADDLLDNSETDSEKLVLGRIVMCSTWAMVNSLVTGVLLSQYSNLLRSDVTPAADALRMVRLVRQVYQTAVSRSNYNQENSIEAKALADQEPLTLLTSLGDVITRLMSRYTLNQQDVLSFVTSVTEKILMGKNLALKDEERASKEEKKTHSKTNEAVVSNEDTSKEETPDQ